MATDTDSTRITLAKRAAITWIVCAQLAFCGCRSPWRSWKNDEPSLEQLLLHPEPWDAEARLAQESPTRRAGSQPSNDQSSGKAYPYAARSNPDTDTAANDKEGEQASQAEFEAAYAAAPPHLRGLLKRQWEAMQAHNARQLAGGGSDEDADDDAGDAEDDSGGESDEDAEAQIAPRVARSSDAPVSYRMSDDSSAAAQPDRARSDAQSAARARNSTAKSQEARQSRAALSDGSKGEDTVIYSLSDTAAESTAAEITAQKSPQRKTTPDELAPPPSKQAARQVAHAEPIDTGAGDDVMVKPVPAGSSPQQASVAANEKSANKNAAVESAAKSVRPEQPANYVTTASAAGKTDSAASTAAATVAPASAEEQPVAQTADLNWRDHVREALRQLEEESTEAQPSPAEQLHRQATSRMLRLTLGELEPALKPIDGLQTHEQEFFRHQFQSLHDAIDPKGNPVLSRRWTLALDSHRKAMAHLAAVSNLEIKNASFCTDVHSYGVVSKFSNPHFKPNQELLLYCELDNFSAEPVKDGYETQLQGSYEIVDAGGRRVADMLLPEDADICRNQRRDYFIAYRIYMPQKIEPGRYQLRLTIEDMKGRKFGQTALDFQIAP